MEGMKLTDCSDATRLLPEHLLAAYASGSFPMAPGRQSTEVRWYCPDPRAILPLDSFHVPQRLTRALRAEPFEIRIDTAFETTLRACADLPRLHEKGTWISEALIGLMMALHAQGYAHSIESWRGGKWCGGLYGVSLGGAFFGESMVSQIPGASKAALVALVERLATRGFTLLDTQFVNPHLVQFGVTEISRQDYLSRLKAALALPCSLKE